MAVASSEPWLLATLRDELTDHEVGISSLYRLLESFAERHGLEDVTVVVRDDSFGAQWFRRGGRPVAPELLGRETAESKVFCEPPLPDQGACDELATACHLALALHLARYRAGRDVLTNLDNRRGFDDALDLACARSARYGWPFTLLLIDLNDFKTVNDRGGHAKGDEVLRKFGVALRRAVRRGDTAARVGGDEFAVLLNNAEGSEATGFTERLRRQIGADGVPLEFSVGMASSPHETTNPVELFRLADQRLYEDKGRRR